MFYAGSLDECWHFSNNIELQFLVSVSSITDVFWIAYVTDGLTHFI